MDEKDKHPTDLVRPSYGLREELLTEDEVCLLIYRCMVGTAPKGWRERDLVRVATWAQEARIRSALVEMVLSGDISAAELRDSQPLLHVTEQGAATAKALMEKSAHEKSHHIDRLQQRVAELEAQVKALSRNQEQAYSAAAEAEDKLATARADARSLMDKVVELKTDNERLVQENGRLHAERQLAEATAENQALEALLTSGSSTSFEVGKQEQAPPKPAPTAANPDLNGKRSGGTALGEDGRPVVTPRRKIASEPPAVPRVPAEKILEKIQQPVPAVIHGMKLPKVFAKCAWAKKYEQACQAAKVPVRIVTREGTWIVEAV